MKSVLVLGKNGQLAQSLKKSSGRDLKVEYLGSDELDLTKTEQIVGKLQSKKFDVLINTAAYTAVDMAEDEYESAHKINAESLGPIAVACRDKNALLIHVSTDYVFGHSSAVPINEEQDTMPNSVYGKTKLEGEKTVRNICANHLIIRTSWLYSNSGKNFLNTMLRLAEERDEISVVYDQIGTPTFSDDLAETIWKLIDSESIVYGTYHFSNEGVASWYDFAKAIFEITGKEIQVIPILSDAFPTRANRPQYSVLAKQKIKDTFGIAIPYWRESLKKCINQRN